MAHPPDSLLLTRGQAARFGRRVLDATLDHIYGRARATYSGASKAELDRLFDEPLPQGGRSPVRVLEECRRKVFRHSMHMSHPRIFGLFNPAPLPVAAFAELPVAFLNQSVDAWKAGPSATHLEMRLVRWMNDLIGFGRDAFGVFTSGGGVANAIALKMARDRVAGIRTRTAGLPRKMVGRLRVYASEQAHFSIARTLDLLGLGEEALVRIEADAGMKMRLDHLASAIARDVGRGLVPMAVVATAGTTNTGAVDDLAALAALAGAEGLWLHVDAAYGGFFLLTERGRRIMRGIERADSVTLDPHKGLFLPYGTGALVVRDGGALRRAHRMHADYLPALPQENDLIDFSEVSPELSRPFRGLRVWLPLKMLGLAPFRRALDEKLDLAAWAADELRKTPGIEVVAEPELSLLAFRLRRPGLDEPALDALNRRLLDRVNARRRVYLTGTVAHGRFLCRICVLSFRTHLDRMRAAVEDIRAAVAEAGI